MKLPAVAMLAFASFFLLSLLHLVKSSDDKAIPEPSHPDSSAPGPSNSTSNVNSSTTPAATNTTDAPSMTSATTTAPEPTTAPKPTAASEPTSPSKEVTTEAVKPTPAKFNVTVTPPKPVLPSVSMTATPKAAAAQASSSGFSAASFIGGIVLTLGLLAIGYVGCKTYHTKRGVQYRTIDEHDAII